MKRWLGIQDGNNPVSCHQKIQAHVRSCNSNTARLLLLHCCLLGGESSFPSVERLCEGGRKEFKTVRVQDSKHVVVCPIHCFYNSGQ